jgi:hypothetical protein
MSEEEEMTGRNPFIDDDKPAARLPQLSRRRLEVTAA